MSLLDLARNHGRTLSQVGVSKHTAWAINAGLLRAGPRSIARIAAELGLQEQAVANACDASWNAKKGLPTTDPAPVDPSSHAHATDDSASVPA